MTMTTAIFYSDATKLAELIRNREISPVEVVQAHLDRIEAVNPKINAIVSVAEGALEAARAAEAAVLAGEKLGPLHGVPFTVKDSIDTAGVLTQRGSPIFRGRIPDTDATSVARMKKAGGILLAKTNLPEFSYWIESDNLLSGRSNNPWDVTRTPGGSSGGESAAIGNVADRSRHRSRHLRAWPGRANRDHLHEGDAWPRAHDRHLAARTAPLLARRADGPLGSRHRARFLATGRA
jgi:Asp-tRNA(Asn)/Glu-tRNA(Gln) amidotransferase A subunit family amidase